MSMREKLHTPQRYIKAFLKWGFLGVLMGAIGGLLGTGFHYALHGVTHLRQQYRTS